MIVMKSSELVDKLVDIVENYHTRYMYASYGFKITNNNISGKAQQNLNGWYTQDRVRDLRQYADRHPTWWGFDCVNLIKGILWGWCGDESKNAGGAQYGANGVPDTNANGLIDRCMGVTTNFARIQIGEVVWMPGHVGVYIGEGLCVECTPRWDNGVQISRMTNMPNQHGEISKTRTWSKHGKLPWVTYSDWSAESATLGDGILKRGMTGDAVRSAQELLIKLGYSCGIDGADGDFGGNTESAVIRFQHDHDIFPSGAIDAPTLEALVSQDQDDAPVIVTPTSKRHVEVTGSTVNVRTGNGTNYSAYTAVTKGQKLELIAESENRWFAVVCCDHVGWISGEYAKEVK